MFLQVWRDKNVGQINDNLTILDVLSCQDGNFQLFKFSGDWFFELKKQDEMLRWVKVPEAKPFFIENNRFHQ